MPPQAIIAGGLINGVQVDTMTFLMHKLTENYSQLGEETRLAALTELMNFAWWTRTYRPTHHTV